MTRVKICGITDLADAILSVKLGADALGFNFYAKSPRYVSPELAKSIVNNLPADVVRIGVFVNVVAMRIKELVDLVGLHAVQLHGDENEHYVDELRGKTDAKIIKAFRVSPNFRAERVRDFKVDGVLLDAFSANKYGGTGDSFEWAKTLEVKKFCSELYLAGGLTPDNVAEAVGVVRPYSVDVASGVESANGRKDPAKLMAFINNAKKA
jgi:phosphoribosylanthranilate isomerase